MRFLNDPAEVTPFQGSYRENNTTIIFTYRKAFEIFLFWNKIIFSTRLL